MSRRHFFQLVLTVFKIFQKLVYLNGKKYGLLKNRLIKCTKTYNTLEFTAKTMHYSQSLTVINEKTQYARRDGIKTQESLLSSKMCIF